MLGRLKGRFNFSRKISSKEWNNLALAAQHSDVKKLEKLLNRTPQAINNEGLMGKTLLILAAEFEVSRGSQCDICDKFYGAGYVVNKSNDFRDTVKLLLEKGAFINATDEGKRTVLDIMDFVITDNSTKNGRAFLESKAFLVKNGAKRGLEIKSPMRRNPFPVNI